MASTLAAMAMSAFAVGAEAPSSTAQASIPPREATAAVRTYTIPAGSMADALSAFADANGYHLLYDTNLTQTLKTRGLSGLYSPGQGLRLLLSDAGLSYRFVRKGRAVSIVLAQNATGTQSDAVAVPLPQVDVAAPAVAGVGDGGPGSSQAGAGLGGRFTGYTVDLDTPALASKDDTPILQTPFSIQVVPRQVLDDQQAISVQDAIVGNVSSVQPSPDPFYNGFTIRGIPNVNIYRNDLKALNSSNLETANLQSIEVLKGPAAMLFGRLEPGGVVNLVVKRPLEVPYYSVQEQAGSCGLTRTTVDATGPITNDKTWLYRINLDYTHTDSFRNFVTNQNAFIAPTITYHPIEQFRFNLDAEYQNYSFVADSDSAIPAIGNRPANIPISRYLQDPAVTVANPSREERKFIGYDWTFDITKDWSVTNRFAFVNVAYAQRLTDYDSVDETTGDIQRGVWDVNTNRQTISSNLDLKGRFETGPFNHSVLIGTDYYTSHSAIVGFSNDAPTVGPINMFFPTYRLSGYVKLEDNFFRSFGETWKGVYAQDFISFADDKLHLLMGGRYDWADQGSGFSGTSYAAAQAAYQNGFDRAFSPRIGAVVQPAPWLSFYGSFSQSFGANSNAIPAPGRPVFPPEQATQWEGGAKAEFLDKRLTATMAFYDITKSGILQTVPGGPYSTPVGVVESKGAEFDIAGRINENWSLIGSYSFDDARITKSFLGDQGNRLQNVPLNAGSIWAKYDADGDFRGLSLGAGLNVVGERQGDKLPAAGLYHRQRHDFVSRAAKYCPMHGARI